MESNQLDHDELRDERKPLRKADTSEYPARTPMIGVRRRPETWMSRWRGGINQ